jgi:hypothetical protein
MNEQQIALARHALGLPNNRKRSYRNHFVCGPGHTDYENWQQMVANQEAKRRIGSSLSGGDDVFWLTCKGALLALHAGEKLDPEDFFPSDVKDAAARLGMAQVAFK